MAKGQWKVVRMLSIPFLTLSEISSSFVFPEKKKKKWYGKDYGNGWQLERRSDGPLAKMAVLHCSSDECGTVKTSL